MTDWAFSSTLTVVGSAGANLYIVGNIVADKITMNCSGAAGRAASDEGGTGTVSCVRIVGLESPENKRYVMDLNVHCVGGQNVRKCPIYWATISNNPLATYHVLSEPYVACRALLILRYQF